MTTYEIHVLTGDLSKPIVRILKASDGDLLAYLEPFDSDRECSLIVREISLMGKVSTKEVFYGTKEALIMKYFRD